MKEQAVSSLIRSTKIASCLATLALMLGCDPGGGLPGAPEAFRSGFIQQSGNQQIGACISNGRLANDGLPFPEESIVAGEWVLQPELGDEFAGSELDATKWSAQTGDGANYGIPNGWGNGERQKYRVENATVADGNLKIAGEVESVNGSLVYTSARLRTKDKIEVKFGRIEASIKVPTGIALWPAFWMLPTDSPYGTTWAAFGEIDIFETFNPGVASIPRTHNKIIGTIHHVMPSPFNDQQGAEYELDPTDGFHVYAIEWEANEIRWFVDGMHYQTIAADFWRSYYFDNLKEQFDIDPVSGKPVRDQYGESVPALRTLPTIGNFVNGPPGTPYDVDFHILLNMAIGGRGPGGKAPDPADYPAVMEVEYVRVYKCMIGGAGGVESETGAGCGGSAVDGVANPINPDAQKPPTRDIYTDFYPLYTDSVESLVFCSGAGGSVTRGISMDVLEPGPGPLGEGQITVLETTAEVDAEEHGTVLDITTSPGFYRDPQTNDVIGAKVRFSAEDEEVIQLIGMGEQFGESTAEIKLDMYIDEANTDPNAIMRFTMQSSDRSVENLIREPSAFEQVLIKDLPVMNEWFTLGLRLDALIDKVDPEQVSELLGIELFRETHIQIDNVQIVCGATTDKGCSIRAPASGIDIPVLDVFVDDFDPARWTNGIKAWDAEFGNDYAEGASDRHVQWRSVDSGESGHDTVLEVDFTLPNIVSVIFIQSATPLDLAAFETGKLVFDIRVTEGSTTGFEMKIDCKDPCSSGAKVLPALTAGEWVTVEYNIADLVATGLDLGRVNTGIVIISNTANGPASIQLDNVRWLRDGGELPPPPPPEGSQPPTPAPVGSLVVYDESLAGDWQLWDCCAGATVTEVDVSGEGGVNAAYGMVAQITYEDVAQGTVAGFKHGSSIPESGTDYLDISQFVGGTVEFDARIVAYSDQVGAPWNIQFGESTALGTAVDVPLATGHGNIEKPPGEWAHYKWPLDGLNVDLSKVRIGLIFPVWRNAAGAIIQFDNVHFAPPATP